MRITVSGETAQDAADFAGIVTGVFMEYHKQQQSRRIEEEIARGMKRIEAGERKAELARRRYNEFREKHGIADLSTEQQSMFDSAASLRADSELAVPEIRALEAEVSSLETLLASTPKTSVVGGGSLAGESRVRPPSTGAGERASLAISGSPAGSSASAAS